MAKAKTPRSSSKTSGNGSTDGRKNLIPINIDEEIRRRAYELWEERGYEAGHQDEHWLLAEREVLERYTPQREHSA